MTPLTQIQKMLAGFKLVREGLDEMESSLLEWGETVGEQDYATSMPAEPVAPALVTPTAAEPAPAPAPEPTPTVVKEPLTFEQARKTASSYAKMGYTKQLKATLDHFQVAKLSDLRTSSDPLVWEKFVTLFMDLIGDGEANA